jgi:hypothetical protein
MYNVRLLGIVTMNSLLYNKHILIKMGKKEIKEISLLCQSNTVQISTFRNYARQT